ncbi:hypothetical protein TrRE_jg12, partial [Triparma retinervis]
MDNTTYPDCNPGGTKAGHIIPGSFFILFFTTVYYLDILHCLTNVRTASSRRECDSRSGDLLNDRKFLLYMGTVTFIASAGGAFMELVPSMSPDGRPWLMSILHLGLYSSWLLVSFSSILQRSGYLGDFSMILACAIASWFNAVILSGHLDQHEESAGEAMRDLHFWLAVSSLLASMLCGVATLAPRSFRLR